MQSTDNHKTKKWEINEELIERVQNNLKYKKRISRLNVGFLVYLFMIMAIVVIRNNNLNSTVPDLISIAIVSSIIVAPFISSFLEKKRRSYPVNDYEWALYYSEATVRSLDKYLLTEHAAMRIKYQKESLKLCKSFLECVKENWKVGSFILAKKCVGNTISNLRDNLQFVIIPAIKEGNAENVRKVKVIFEALKANSEDLNIEALNRINDTSKEIILAHKVLINKKTKLENDIFHSRTLKKHTYVVSGIIFGCITFGIFLYYVGLSKEFSVGSSLTLFGILLVAYQKK